MATGGFDLGEIYGEGDLSEDTEQLDYSRKEEIELTDRLAMNLGQQQAGKGAISKVKATPYRASPYEGGRGKKLFEFLTPRQPGAKQEGLSSQAAMKDRQEDQMDTWHKKYMSLGKSLGLQDKDLAQYVVMQVQKAEEREERRERGQTSRNRD